MSNPADIKITQTAETTEIAIAADLNEFPTQFDVIIVGSGAAGLYAALRLPAHLKIGLITKDKLKYGSSSWAQGGIAAAIAPTDSAALHYEDTIKAGVGLCDPDAVRFLVETAPEAIDSLLKLGVAFDRHGKDLAMTLEAAHSRPRVLHSADTTGKAVVTVLIERVLERTNIQVITQALVLRLWQNEQTKRCQGVCLLYRNQIHWLAAGAVILATGGGGQVYAQTTNPTVSVGDGVAIAWRAGAKLRDLEFVQFHPTALHKENAPHFLISEAVRGEGAHLVDEKGDRFAFNYDPAGELAPRDVVSRAIFQHLLKTNLKMNLANHSQKDTASNPNQAIENVYLDLRPIPTETINRRFPQIIQVCQKYAIDVFTTPIPVAPANHYWMGGVAVDLNSQTSIPGLYAIGEVASTGVHGANRLASNSLLECLVFAATLAQLEPDLTINSINFKQPPIQPEDQTRQIDTSNWPAEIEIIKTIRQELPQLMWRSAAISRESDVLSIALEQVKEWRSQLTNLSIYQFINHLQPEESNQFTNSLTSPFANSQAEQYLRQAIEVMNLLDVSYLILRSALFRTESRGGHYRQDFPETQEQWRVHTIVQGDRLTTSPIHPIQ
ncbi:L-aspartate oxidase (plasmid) [Thalassoporum mexicanum PCC 7367]|uniref:L-aspartate oxidase n=1 Tax=Thalassoporum mexicanum TaxID=3457544 RepID=UPI00029FA40E|nr:L-aspartate oxidase [Pseudanabaena sp. PCC 7367]AFY72147.1 L-aspartate oxidase [Pseudanabaena sp. PCC 7367]